MAVNSDLGSCSGDNLAESVYGRRKSADSPQFFCSESVKPLLFIAILCLPRYSWHKEK